MLPAQPAGRSQLPRSNWDRTARRKAAAVATGLLLVLVPGLALAAPQTPAITLQGVLAAAHGDDFVGGHVVERTHLLTSPDGAITQVKFDRDQSTKALG